MHLCDTSVYANYLCHANWKAEGTQRCKEAKSQRCFGLPVCREGKEFEQKAMNNLSTTISQGFAHYFQDFRQRVEELSNDLSEEEFWSNPYPYGTSIGNLVLHLTGNLSYYIGTQLAGSGYVRNREEEFDSIAHPGKAETLAKLEEAVNLVLSTLATQSDADWSSAYSAVGVDDVHDRFSIFLRCAVHFHHHIGQMGYTRDELIRKRRLDQSR